MPFVLAKGTVALYAQSNGCSVVRYRKSIVSFHVSRGLSRAWVERDGGGALFCFARLLTACFKERKEENGKGHKGSDDG